MTIKITSIRQFLCASQNISLCRTHKNSRHVQALKSTNLFTNIQVLQTISGPLPYCHRCTYSVFIIIKTFAYDGPLMVPLSSNLTVLNHKQIYINPSFGQNKYGKLVSSQENLSLLFQPGMTQTQTSLL